MEQIILRPSIQQFSTMREFLEEFRIRPEDLVFTSEPIFLSSLAKFHFPCRVLLQERYGRGEPTDVMVEGILRDAAEKPFDRIVAVGGGTIMDIAKILRVSSGEPVDELYKLPALQKRHPLTLIPTTCGTGSEVTNIAIVNRTRLGVKMGLVGEAMYADSAVLVPELLEGLPFPVFAASSIDALVHAVESGLSPRATAYTRLFSYRALEMILRGYQKIVREGRGALPPLYGDFLTSSNFAGIAFGTAGCAAVHALSYPLGSKYHVAHGESNYAVFTGVLKNYLELRQDGEILVMNRRLAELLGCDVPAVYDSLEALLNRILPKKPLRAYGVAQEELPEFTDSVVQNQQRLLKNNFVPFDAPRILKIYRELY